jgi:hypothetical protein
MKVNQYRVMFNSFELSTMMIDSFPMSLSILLSILPWSETFSILLIHLSVSINRRRSMFHHSDIEKYTSIWIRVSGPA